MISRNRLIYAALVIFVVILGLSSRHFAFWPSFVHTYIGDILWALMVFLIFGFLLPRHTSFQLAASALCFSYCIEFSQLYHTPWIDAIRHTRLGGLVLGFGFLWSDLLSYLVGIGFGTAIERAMRAGPSNS